MQNLINVLVDNSKETKEKKQAQFLEEYKELESKDNLTHIEKWSLDRKQPYKKNRINETIRNIGKSDKKRKQLRYRRR